MENTDDPTYDEVLTSLQKIDPNLYFSFCSSPGTNEFIVTAEGIKRLFPLVEEIIQYSPDLADWKFFALKPQQGFPVTTHWEETEISIDEVLVLPVFKESGEMGLRMYIPSLTPSNEEDIHNALLRALDSGLGEKRFAEQIEATWVYSISEAPADAFHLTKLDDYLNELFYIPLLFRIFILPISRLYCGV